MLARILTRFTVQKRHLRVRRRAYLESNAQEIQDPHRQPPALAKDVRDLALVRRQGGGHRLLRLSVYELAKVEGPVSPLASCLHLRGDRGISLLEVSGLGEVSHLAKPTWGEARGENGRERRWKGDNAPFASRGPASRSGCRSTRGCSSGWRTASSPLCPTSRRGVSTGGCQSLPNADPSFPLLISESLP